MTAEIPAEFLSKWPAANLEWRSMNRLRALAALDPLIDRVRSILMPHSRAQG